MGATVESVLGIAECKINTGRSKIRVFVDQKLNFDDHNCQNATDIQESHVKSLFIKSYEWRKTEFFRKDNGYLFNVQNMNICTSNLTQGFLKKYLLTNLYAEWFYEIIHQLSQAKYQH